MDCLSLLSRESTTLSSGWPQKGHFIALAALSPAWQFAAQYSISNPNATGTNCSLMFVSMESLESLQGLQMLADLALCMASFCHPINEISYP